MERFTMGKGLNECQYATIVKVTSQGRPAPISSFGAGQGETNISEYEWK